MDLPGEDTAGARPSGTEAEPGAPPPSPALAVLKWVRKGLGYSGLAVFWGFVLIVFGWPLAGAVAA